MSRLVAIIDAYKDQHGQPSDSSVARAIGVKPQTLSSWRTRGLKEPPDRDALRELARLAGLDYETEVLRAALLDSGWIEPKWGERDDRPAANKLGPSSLSAVPDSVEDAIAADQDEDPDLVAGEQEESDTP